MKRKPLRAFTSHLHESVRASGGSELSDTTRPDVPQVYGGSPAKTAPIDKVMPTLDAVLAAGVVLEATTSGRAHTCACSRAQPLNVVGAAPVTAHVVSGDGVACGPSVCACDDAQGIT